MTRITKLMLLTTAASAMGLAGQSGQSAAPANDQLNARDIFWSSADLVGSKAKAPSTKTTATKTTATAKASTATAAVTPPTAHTTEIKGQLGLRYTLLKTVAGGGQVEVLPDTAFKAGDRIRLSIESNRTGYLYIIQQGSTGTWRSLYPEEGQEHEVLPGKEYIVPSGGSFEFDEHAGQERLFVLLSQSRMQDLESLVTEAQSNASAKPAADHSVSDVISEIKMANRDLVFTKAAKDAPAAGAKQQDSAMYVVNKNADANRVVVDMVLKHQ